MICYMKFSMNRVLNFFLFIVLFSLTACKTSSNFAFYLPNEENVIKTNIASEYYNIHKGNISTCCKGKNKSAGKFPDGTPLVWRYIRWNHNKKYRIGRGDV